MCSPISPAVPHSVLAGALGMWLLVLACMQSLHMQSGSRTELRRSPFFYFRGTSPQEGTVKVVHLQNHGGVTSHAFMLLSSGYGW